MSDIYTLNATKREVLGSKVKQLRKEGQCPAVLYGLGQESVSLTIESTPFVKLYDEVGSSTLIDVVIDGAAPEKALVGEIQTHPVTDRLQHVDLKRVNMSESISTSIPLVFVGESLAVKGLSGSLTTQLDAIDVECLPGDLVSEIEVDLSVLATFDDVIKVSDLNVPASITVLVDQDQLVATVNPPRSEKELEDLDSEVVEDVTTVGGVKKESDASSAEDGSKE